MDIVLSSDDVLYNILNSLLDDSFANIITDDNNLKNYTLGKMRFAQDVLDKRTIAYQIARELTEFFCEYNGKKKLDTATKNLIMSILANFSLVTKASNNTDYNKLFSDAKNRRLPICDHCYQPTIIKDVGILDYTIIKTVNFNKSDIAQESAKKWNLQIFLFYTIIHFILSTFAPRTKRQRTGWNSSGGKDAASHEAKGNNKIEFEDYES